MNLALDITDTKIVELPNFGNPSKMKGTARTWSTLAVTHCPGARENGELVPACANCYADKGNYRWGNVKAPRLVNAEQWKLAGWVDAMVDKIGQDKFFRWFDSGDCFDVRLAEKILEVMKRTPNTRHWMPTRMYKFRKFKAVFDRMNRLPNVVVRFSSDGINGERLRHAQTSTIIQQASQAGDAHVCPATGDVEKKQASCAAQGCTACWEKNVRVIAYNFH